MFLPLDPSSGVPIYRQIMDQVRRMVVAGTLRSGERLPSVRDLAISLRINPLTVAKAYGELEQQGVVESRRGIGVFVSERVMPERRTQERDGRFRGPLRDSLQRFLLEAAQAGLTAVEIRQMVDEAFEQLRGKRGKERS
jgi:GntR family transcriptional regulator